MELAVHAPADGTVSAVHVSGGELVRAGQAAGGGRVTPAPASPWSRSGRATASRTRPRSCRPPPRCASSSCWPRPACRWSRRRRSCTRRAVPQLADADEVLPGDRTAGPASATRCWCRTCAAWSAPIAAGADAVAVFTAASEAFAQANISMTIAESLEAFAPVLAAAPSGRHVDARLRVDGVRLPLPGRGRPGRRGATWRSRWHELGCDQISIGDTIGVAEPDDVAASLAPLLERVPARAAGAAPPRHARPRARQRRGRPRSSASPPSTPPRPASADARSHPARPATWPPRRWSHGCTASASRPAWTSPRCSRRPPTSAPSSPRTR